ncbi:hypothetical protein BDB00DRAFT_795436 [Zychaea mexicana]|uniref:uncharacterized protein n=1 Tax=Zychaea mexicana TaxID=64656 RepID=UPI0022FEECB0|nr:uncharacterized protein BDB00DRAFT_795436 [Zychaea mexicana]KAI9499104.1 hypothetical protein BDB00DRAFT_795436 [Zychaea mexicana]
MRNDQSYKKIACTSSHGCLVNSSLRAPLKFYSVQVSDCQVCIMHVCSYVYGSNGKRPQHAGAHVIRVSHVYPFPSIYVLRFPKPTVVLCLFIEFS